MSRSTARGGVRTWGVLAASMGLLASGAAVVGAAPSAVSAAPAETCKTAFPVDELVIGDDVDGLTVTRGTEPQPFTGKVLGVLDDGIALDLDMVMVELDMPEFDRTKGIWQGMSGSPVYAADGRLIGAVAYGLSWGPSPVAGVTPYEEMDNYLTAAPSGPIAVDRRTARTIARETNVTVAQAEQGFTQLRMPMGVSGLSSERLAKAAGVDKPYAPKGSYLMGRSSGAAAGPETIVAGGNLAASVAYGDVTMAGVGTATSVCEDEVVGFGHPLAFLGKTSLSLHPADALFIQPESLGAPFKVANLGAPVGVITQDRLAGITGAVGAAPDAADITSMVDFEGRSRPGATHVTVPDFTANAVFGHFLSNHDRVLDGIVEGTELQEWTITGLRPNGSEFSLTYADRYTSSYDITWYSVFDLADLVWSLSDVPGVTVASVDVDSDVTDDTGVWKVASVEQRRSGTWTKITRKSPAVARAGKTLRLRTVLSGPGGTRTVPVRFAVPRRVKAARTVYLNVTGGSQLYSDNWVRSVKEAEEMVDSAVRNDEIRVEFGTPDRLSFGGYGEDEEFDFGPRRYSFVKSKLLGPLDQVVEGSKLFKVRLR
jgi:hypothetical protein